MADSENSKGSARKSAALFHDAALRDLQALAQVPNEKNTQFRLDVCCAGPDSREA